MNNSRGVFFAVIFSFVALVLQSTLFEFLKIGNVKPDLVLLVVIFTAVQGGVMAGQVTGFFAGLIQGFASPPFGLHALVKTVIGHLFGLLEGSVSIDPFFIRLLLALIGVVAKTVLSLLVMAIFGIPGMPAGEFFATLGLESLYTMILAPGVFFILKKFVIFTQKGAETY